MTIYNKAKMLARLRDATDREAQETIVAVHNSVSSGAASYPLSYTSSLEECWDWLENDLDPGHVGRPAVQPHV